MNSELARPTTTSLETQRVCGYTLIELVVVAALLSIMALVALPTAKYTMKRSRELELSSALRQLRFAIDEHKRYADAGLIAIEQGTDGYPEEIEVLYEGIELVNNTDGEVRFLRKLPVDPMTGVDEWGIRSTQDDTDSNSWGGENVFDVYSESEGIGLNGIPYAEW